MKNIRESTPTALVMTTSKKVFVRRRFLTVLELLVTLTLTVLIFNLVGVNAYRMVVKEKGRSALRSLVDQLNLAQEVMLTVDTDVVVKITMTGKGKAKCSIEVENPLPKPLEKQVLSPKKIRGLPNFRFQDQATGETFDNKAVIEFLSGGSKMTRGRLDFRTGKKIIIPGYPCLIRYSGKEEKREHDAIVSQELYPKQAITENQETPTPSP